MEPRRSTPRRASDCPVPPATAVKGPHLIVAAIGATFSERVHGIGRAPVLLVPPFPGLLMCRNIRTLHNFQPPATDEEIRAASLQFVRKLCGFTRPSKANELAFGRAVDRVAEAAHELLDLLVANTPPRDREVEARKARARAAARFPPAASRARRHEDQVQGLQAQGDELQPVADRG